MAKRKKEFTEKEQKLLLAIGNKLVSLRKKAGYTNYENFAFENSINRSQYGKYEAGTVDIQITTLHKIIDKHKGITLKKFFEDLEY